MNHRFTTILWDVDGTLLDFVYSQRYAITKCFHTIGREITEEEIGLYARINDDYWLRLELGEITKAELLPGRFTALFSALGIEGVDVEAFRLEYQAALGSVFSYLDDSLTVCKKLQGRVKQYVITNGVTSTQQNKLKISGLGEVMDGIFISEQVGYHKPDQRFFDYCLEQICMGQNYSGQTSLAYSKHTEEMDRQQILIVGDSLTSDIKGGIQAGIPTCWYNRTGNVNNTYYKPDYEIHCLGEIYDIIG